MERIHEVLKIFHDYVKPTGYVAGTDHITLADFACLVTMELIYSTGLVDVSAYEPVLKDWFERCKSQIPNYATACDEGVQEWTGWFKAKLNA